MDHQKSKLIFENWNAYLNEQKEQERHEKYLKEEFKSAINFIKQINEEVYRDLGVRVFSKQLLNEAAAALNPANVGKAVKLLGTGSSGAAKAAQITKALTKSGIPTKVTRGGDLPAFLSRGGGGAGGGAAKVAGGSKPPIALLPARGGTGGAGGALTTTTRATGAGGDLASMGTKFGDDVVDITSQGRVVSTTANKSLPALANTAAKNGKVVGAAEKSLAAASKTKKVVGLGTAVLTAASLIPFFDNDDDDEIQELRDKLEKLTAAKTGDEYDQTAKDLEKSSGKFARAASRAKKGVRKAMREGGMRIRGAKRLQAVGYGVALDPREDFMQIYNEFYADVDKFGKGAPAALGKRDMLFGPKHRRALALIGGKKLGAEDKKTKASPKRTSRKKMPKIAGTDDLSVAQQYQKFLASRPETKKAAPEVPERVVRKVSVGQFVSPVIINRLAQAGISEEDILAAAAEYHSKFNLEGEPPKSIRTQR